MQNASLPETVITPNSESPLFGHGDPCLHLFGNIGEEGHAHLLLDEADRHRDTAQFRAGAGFRTVGEGLDPETDGLQFRLPVLPDFVRNAILN